MSSPLSEMINSMSLQEKSNLVTSLLLVKDINKVPFAAFETVNTCLKGALANESEESVEALALTICQYLSLNNMLITNVNDKKLTRKEFDNFNNSKEVVRDASELNTYLVDFVDNYKLNHYQTLIRNEFVEFITSLTNNQDILTCATNFIYYHSNPKLSEDDKITRDLALINLIKLSIKEGLKEQLKAVLLDMDVDFDSFIIQHIQMFVS